MANTVVQVLKLLAAILYNWVKAVTLAFVPTSFIAKDVSGQTVVITGAGSGIGRLLALEFAALHCRLALWDINDGGNEESARMVAELGGTVRTYHVDVSDRHDVYKAAAKVTSELGPVDIVVNNAGVVTGQKFLDCPDNKVVTTMAVNVMAHFWTVKAFLPAMMARNHGHLVSVASSAGLVGANGLCDYCSSKFAAVGFDESLRYELRSQGKTGVHTTVVCPYLINTGMFDGCAVRFPWLMDILQPEGVAREVVKAVLRNQHVLVLPKMLYIFIALKGILPCKALQVLADSLGASSLMDTFKGRQQAPR